MMLQYAVRERQVKEIRQDKFALANGNKCRAL